MSNVQKYIFILSLNISKPWFCLKVDQAKDCRRIYPVNGKQFLDVRRNWLWVILLTVLPVSGTFSKVSIQWCAFLTGVETADCCCLHDLLQSACGDLCCSIACICCFNSFEFTVLKYWYLVDQRRLNLSHCNLWLRDRILFPSLLPIVIFFAISYR